MHWISGGEERRRFESFVAEVSDGLVRTGYLMTGDLSEAEDLVQETLLRCARTWKRLRSMEFPAAYGRRVLVHLVIDGNGRRGAAQANSRLAPTTSIATPTTRRLASCAASTRVPISASHSRRSRRASARSSCSATGRICPKRRSRSCSDARWVPSRAQRRGGSRDCGSCWRHRAGTGPPVLPRLRWPLQRERRDS